MPENLSDGPGSSRRGCPKLCFVEGSSIAPWYEPVHDFLVNVRPKLVSSPCWAFGNLALATTTFVALYTVRFSGVGILLLKLVFVGLAGTVVFSIRDLFRSGSRWQGFIALLLCLPVLLLFGLLSVWEGPLYVSVSSSPVPQFKIDGAAGFYGLEIYSPEHSRAEWLEDDIGLVWSLEWQRRDVFPPMRSRFAYGILPPGYSQKTPSNGVAPALNPHVTYTVVVEPAMGSPEYFTLRDGSLTKAEDGFSASVCWAFLPVPGRKNPAYLRVDCETRKPLAMSERGQARLKAYQENRLSYY
jgi:hypothetical protein